jgi:hypothetical protein
LNIRGEKLRLFVVQTVRRRKRGREVIAADLNLVGIVAAMLGVAAATPYRI